MYQRFTDRAQKVMQFANQEALQFNHEYIGTEHLLLGLIDEGSGVAANALKNLRIGPREIRLEVEKLIQSGTEIVTMGKLPQTPTLKRVIGRSMQEAQRLHHNYVGTEHLLLGLVDEHEGVAAQVLKRLGHTPEAIRGEVLDLLGHRPEASRDADSEIERCKTASTPPNASAPTDCTSIYRILDASANRAAEGLRVVEDYLRFVLDDSQLTEEVKQLRHDLAAALDEVGRDQRLLSRNTPGDVGRDVKTADELVRSDAEAVLHASFSRAAQALRSLGEYSKVVAPDAAARFETIRYQTYALECRLAIARDRRARLDGVRLYVLVDGRESPEAFTQLVDALLTAGVHAIQLRDKRLTDRDLVERGRIVRARIDQLGAAALFIMNDRPDLAVLADADGVHVGQDELSVADVRKIVGPRRLVGVSTHSIDQARQAVRDGASYIGVGPTFASTTKEFAAFAGLEYCREVAAELGIAAFAIGGITLENLSQVLATGVTRVAVSGAILNLTDPAAEIRKWLNALRPHEPPHDAASLPLE